MRVQVPVPVEEVGPELYEVFFQTFFEGEGGANVQVFLTLQVVWCPSCTVHRCWCRIPVNARIYVLDDTVMITTTKTTLDDIYNSFLDVK